MAPSHRKPLVSELAWNPRNFPRFQRDNQLVKAAPDSDAASTPSTAYRITFPRPGALKRMETPSASYGTFLL